MKTLDDLPITRDTFQRVIRLHVQGQSASAIGADVGLSATDVEYLQRDYPELWNTERAAVGQQLRSEVVLKLVAHIQLLASIHTDPESAAVLTQAAQRVAKLETPPKPRVRTKRPTNTTPEATTTPEPGEVNQTATATLTVPITPNVAPTTNDTLPGLTPSDNERPSWVQRWRARMTGGLRWCGRLVRRCWRRWWPTSP